jgi:uncharacterized damage-inducible protein DinB
VTMANPFTAASKPYYELLKGWITKSAEMLPEKDYGFHPTEAPAADKKDMRTFGQLIGHVADANSMFCGTSTGLKGPGGDVEKSKTSKADLQKALAESFAFCDQAWAATTDKNALTGVKFPAAIPLPATTRLGALIMNDSHLGEHYGNLVTYLRVKGLVPPSSQGGGM